MSIQIPLKQGQFAIIDNEDFNLVKDYKWHLKKERYTYYVRANIRLSSGKYKMIRLHRLILNLSNSEICDHINGNGLDNRKINIRIATHAQNNANRKKAQKKSSKYKGVCWNKERNLWQANIYLDQKTINLGCFANEEEAAKVYNSSAVKLFGAFAKLNIIPPRAVFLL